MKYIIDNVIYDVEVIKKTNKNTYLRLKKPNIIYITTGYFTTKRQIKKLLDDNKIALHNMHIKLQNKLERDSQFYYLGEVYDIILVHTLKNVEVEEHNIYTPSYEALDKWTIGKCKILFKERLDIIYKKINEDIPYPTLKLRKMTTRWGVCNRKTISVTLNTELIHYNPLCLDYVIVHELSHFVHFNHSKNFWNFVEIYCPNYKKIRKILKG